MTTERAGLRATVADVQGELSGRERHSYDDASWANYVAIQMQRILDATPDEPVDLECLECGGRIGPRRALAADEPGRQSPCDDEQLATAFAKGVVAAHESLAADEPGLDVERLIRDLAQKSGYGQKVADALLRAYAARLRKDAG